MNTRILIGFFVSLVLCISDCSLASETQSNDKDQHARGIFSFVSNNPCAESYRQLALSPPVPGTARGDEGYPWRVLYGRCVAHLGKATLHQDWVVSYLDARPQGDVPGGDGVSFGTDFAFLWHRHGKASLSPYYELGAGLQYAAGTAFPAHGSRWMFTINTGVGILIPLKPTAKLNLAIRYLHISNAGLLPENAGYDAFHLVIGVRW